LFGARATEAQLPLMRIAVLRWSSTFDDGRHASDKIAHRLLLGEPKGVDLTISPDAWPRLLDAEGADADHAGLSHIIA